MISRDVQEQGLVAVLWRDYPKLTEKDLLHRVECVASLSERYRIVKPNAENNNGRDAGPEHPVWLSEFALRLASDPMSLEVWAGQHVDAGIKKLLDVPTLARAARFLVLAVDQQKKSLAAAGEFYAGWRWST